MNSKTVKTLGAVTLLFSAGAWYASTSRGSDSGGAGSGGYAVPALQEKINDVASLVIETKDGTATLERAGGKWTLAEMANYPARESKVRGVLMALRGAEVEARMTADAARFPKLGLAPPGDEGSSSKRVTIQDSAGQAIATVLVGDRRPSRAGFTPGLARPKGQTYIHTGAGGPALLVNGEFTLDARTGTWVDQQMLSVPATRIKAVRVTHQDGEVLALHRGDMADPDFEILDVPEGMEPKSPSATRAFLSTLSGLRFDDVRRADDFEWPEEGIVTTEYFTEDGLRVSFRSAETSGEGETSKARTWCAVTVDVVDPATLPGAELALPEEGPPPPPAEGEGSGAPDDAPAEDPGAGALEKEARAIRDVVDGWVFALPGWKSGPVRMRPEGVLQAIPEEESAEGSPDEATEDSAPDGTATGDPKPTGTGGDGE